MPDEPEDQPSPWAAATFDVLRRIDEQKAEEQRAFGELLQKALEARYGPDPDPDPEEGNQ